MEILNFSFEQFQTFLLILTRISVVLFLFPVIGSNMFPNLAKVGLALILAMILFPVVQLDIKSFPENTFELIILIVAEFFIGLVLGLTIRMFFAGVRLAGRVIGFQMGFMMANVVDPMSGASVSIVEQMGSWIALLIFLLLNGHHAIIMALIESFRLTQIGLISLKAGLFSQVLELSSDMFVLAVKIGAPAIAALLFTSVAFGLCAKFVPQMNILIVGFPLKITVGLLFLGIALDIIGIFMRSYLTRFPSLLTSLLAWMGGG